MERTLGFIGLGTMGLPMATRLARAGHRLHIYNRTPQKRDRLSGAEVFPCETPSEVASQSEIIFSMLSTPEVLREVAGGPDGILTGIRAGSIHLDCSTVSPDVTRELEVTYRRKNATFLHMPVLGSVPQAEEGSLLLFVGGDDTAFKAVEPLLHTIGKRIWHYSKIEQATMMKLICNSFIAGMIGVLTQAIVFARTCGLPPSEMLEIIGQSQMNAPMYQTKGTSMIAGNFTPRFYTEHLAKDARLFVEAGRSMGTPMPVGEVMHDLFTRAMAKGLAKEDYSSILKVFEEMAG
jgi:3-hydroxyisobutyrate dehydrogenase-like beta-hydroxyacid dehydrogenase